MADNEEVYDSGGVLPCIASVIATMSWRHQSLIGPISRSLCQVDIANWHLHVFYLQYISNAIPISRVMSLQYRYNIRMSTGVGLFNFFSPPSDLWTLQTRTILKFFILTHPSTEKSNIKQTKCNTNVIIQIMNNWFQNKSLTCYKN